MKKSTNFIFEVSLSTDAFSDKVISGAMIGTTKNEGNRNIRKQYGYKANSGIGFVRTEVTSEQLLHELLRGKVFCHLFTPSKTKKDGSFGSSEKKDANFVGSYVIGVDIDYTSHSSAESFVDKLSLRPTFFYTSYSNMQINEDGTSKGARFRLIYVFDEMIDNPYMFRYCAWNLNRLIEADTNETIEDDCNLRCSQYFNGTNINNPDLIVSFGLTDNIYSISDISFSKEGYIDFLCNNAYYKTSNNDRINDIINILSSLTNCLYTFNNKDKRFNILKDFKKDNEFTTINDEKEKERQGTNENLTYTVPCDVEYVESYSYSPAIDIILNDYDRLEEDEFVKCTEWENARRKTKYIYRVEKDWNDKTYQYVDNDYFSLYYYPNTVKDGEKRRKSLFQRMCLRRYINPIMTKDEMVVNTIIDIMRFFDNRDGVLNSDFIKRNIDSAFNLSISEIGEDYAGTISYLKEHTRPKRGVIYINKQAHSKETTYTILDECYNPSITVSQNLDYINNDLQYKVSVSTLYNYLSDRKIKPHSDKVTDDELCLLIDPSKSVRKNLEDIKTSGIHVGNNRISRLLNSMHVEK